MSEATGTTIGQIEVPQFSIVVSTDGKGEPFLGALITTSSLMVQAYLCNSDTFDAAYRSLTKQMMKAGSDMRRRKSGLFVAQNIPEGLNGKLRQKER